MRRLPRGKSNIDGGDGVREFRKSKSSLANREILGDQPEFEDLPNRIFVYLQPKTINYDIHNEHVSVEIELTHPKLVITALKDHYTPQNIISLDEFKSEAITFSVTIKQDDIDDLNTISDTPITLTLYENTPQPLVKEQELFTSSESHSFDASKAVEEGENTEELVVIERKHVAQGYIDILEFWNKRRFHASNTTFLYPLPSSANRASCKIEWEIYSLLPPMKNLILSNAAFLYLTSLYNLEDHLVDNCDDLVANLSFVSTMPNENNAHDKVFICSYTGFRKQIIGQQSVDIKWENLKDREKENQHSICINTNSKLDMGRLFHPRLPTEGLEVDVEDFDFAKDYALICNSLHRFVLTDQMENILESVLACNQQHLILELVRAGEPETVLLQGFVELDIFMHPDVANCSYAVELHQPGYRRSTLPKDKHGIPKHSKKAKGQRSSASSTKRQLFASSEVLKEKIPFAALRICLRKPITEPRIDLLKIKQPEKVAKDIFTKKCAYKIYTPELPDAARQCEINYCAFDETIEGIVDYMVKNNIKTIEDDRKFFCNQLGNMNNNIIKLVACDFNERIKTTTNTQFTELMTVVYKELEKRIYNIVRKCSFKDIEDCAIRKDLDCLTIIKYMQIIKLMEEVGNLEVVVFMLRKLDGDYPNNSLLHYYKFLSNLENENFDEARKYLEMPIKEKEMEGEKFNDLITLYINYKQDLMDPEKTQHAYNYLLNSLTKACTNNVQEISLWILLFCIYKRLKYLPGMEYCRWNYENLYKSDTWEIPLMPTSRWDIYMAYKLEFISRKGIYFFKVVNLLNALGLYEFGEWVFDEIANEAMEVEKYFFYSTFNILRNIKLEPKFKVKNFPVEKFLNATYLRATLSQVNGNLEYYRNPSSPASMKHYSVLSGLKDLDNLEHFHLGLFRYSYRMMEELEFEKAHEGFSLCCSLEGSCIVAAIGRGKAFYKLGYLDKAERAFAQSTYYGMHLPNVWAYLALINLRKGENFKALECWKYARLNFSDDIHVEILSELNKIDIDDIDLYVDVPEKRSASNLSISP